MKNTWGRWKNFVVKAAHFQANILLSVVYIIIITPLAYIIKLIHPASLKGYSYNKKENSYWVIRPSEKHDLKFAKKQ